MVNLRKQVNMMNGNDTSRHRPDWVVFGTPEADGKVAVYASKDLTRAEIEARCESGVGYDLLDEMRTFAIQVRRYTLTVEMKTFTMVVADSYPQAFEYLFRSWSPEPDRVQAQLGR